MFRVKEGDLERLGLLYERYKKILFAFFYRMNFDESLSRDLVQNVFVRILNYRKTFRGDGEFKVWMFHIARNVNHEHFRKNKRYHNSDSLEQKHEWLTQYPEELSRETLDHDLELLRMAINRLSAEKYGIRSIPTLLFFKNGQLVDKQIGVVPKQMIAEKIQSLI